MPQRKPPGPTIVKSPATAATIPTPKLLLGGLLLLTIAEVLSAMLVAEHFTGFGLPGCGPGSACARAAASAWGKVPGTNWPVSFLGLAYFSGLVAAWSVQRGRLGAFRNVVRFGAAVSIVFMVVILVERHLCTYCIGVHAANLAFWMMLEFAEPISAGWSRPAIAFGVIGLALSGILAVGNTRARQAASDKAEAELSRSVAEMANATSRAASTAGASGSTALSTQPAKSKVFTGRWQIGPSPAPIRIVIFTDYQCTDCKRIENELRTLMAERKDVSLSVKHFPMCTDCNPHMRGVNMHPNACWAARAAEAAGEAYGTNGFWKLHHWLFEKGGSFTNADFPPALQQLGFEPKRILDLMQTPAMLQRVQADVAEAFALGLHYTPMIFINGVELKGWNAESAVRRAVMQVADMQLPPRGPERDAPPPALEKMVADWVEQPVFGMPADSRPHVTGVNPGVINVVVWGDPLEPNTAALDKIIRDFMRGRNDVSYDFRFFPFEKDCNPHVTTTRIVGGCRAAAIAEAAGLVGGDEAFWRVQEWLLANQKAFSDDAFRRAAPTLGVDAEKVLTTAGTEGIRATIEEDIQQGKTMRLTSIPHVFVNNKFVPRWYREGENVMVEIFARALEQAGQ